MRFQNPLAFQSLWILVILISVILFLTYWRQKKIKQQFSERNFQLMTDKVSRKKIWIKFGLECFAVIFLVIALARPQLGQGTVEIKQEGFEIMLLVDVSESMMAEDLKPNRLALAKLDLERFIDSMPGYRMGLVAFAGSAAILSPLTNDPGALKMYVDSLDPQSVSAQGTSFENGLKIAMEAFERGSVGADETRQVTRVILMISDGEDHEEGALELAKKLTEQNIRLFTVAYGTEKGGAIPVRDQMGYMRGYKQDENRSAVISQVNGEALSKLAEAGKGTFSFAIVGGGHLKKISDDLSVLEKTQYDATTATQYEEKFQIFLLISLFLIILDLALSERKSLGGHRPAWKGRLL